MNEKKLQDIISHYKRYRAANPETWFLHCAQQNTIEEAIYVAAVARNHEQKKNKHQWRLKNIDLEKFAVALVDKADDIKQSTSFDELLAKIELYKTHGIGTLTVYDTAERIGVFMNIFPDKIYLHAGVKVGAEKILGRKLQEKYILKEHLPRLFQQSDLHCGAIEDILCLYKDVFDDENEAFIPRFFPNAYGRKKKRSC
jgi:hypothetical protein